MAYDSKHHTVNIACERHNASYPKGPLRLNSTSIHNWIQNENGPSIDTELDESSSHYMRVITNGRVGGDNKASYSSFKNTGHVESEREISEITHDNTLYANDTLENFNHSCIDSLQQEPLLIKEITETIEIDGAEEGRVRAKRQLGSRRSLEIGDCDDTRVTMIRDVRANIVGADGLPFKVSAADPRKNQSCHGQATDGFQPRVDLETLYIVQHARKQNGENGQLREIPVIKEDRKITRLAERLQMDDLLRLNSLLTSDNTADDAGITKVYEEEITRRYELHEYHDSVCLLMYIGEVGDTILKCFHNVQRRTLKKYEDKCQMHLDVIISPDLDSFVLPYKSKATVSHNGGTVTSDCMVSVNYIQSEDKTLLGCEKRQMCTLSGPIQDALREPKAKIGKCNQYLAILVVTVNACRTFRDRLDSLESAASEDDQYKSLTSFTSHQIVEFHLPLMEELRRNIQINVGTLKPPRELTIRRMDDLMDQKCVSTKSVQDEAVQVKPSMCDTAVNSSVLNTMRKSMLIRSHNAQIAKHDAATSPIHSEQFELTAKDDEYVADIFCTNLDLRTSEDRRTPQLTGSVKRQWPLKVEKAESSTVSDTVDEERPSYDYDYSTIASRLCRDNTEERSDVSNSTIINVGVDNNKASVTPDISKLIVEQQRVESTSEKPKTYSGVIPINRISANRMTGREQDRPDSGAQSGASKHQPIVVRNKIALIGETLNQLRRSIRQHHGDTYRVNLDTKQRCNSWSFNGPGRLQRDTTGSKSVRPLYTEERSTDRHVRAKLIPVWNSRSSKEYFARVEDYINEDAARSIKRSYSTSYLTPGSKSRIRWVRIPGETIRIEEQRITDIFEGHKVHQPRYGTGAQCRELPYELRYWNILQLLNKEKESGRQLGEVHPYPLEEWILTGNFRNGVKQTAEEILSPQYKVQSPEDSALLWFLTYDDNAKVVTKKYIDTLMTQGSFRQNVAPSYYSMQPMEYEAQTKPESNYRRIEKFVRYERLPDRVVPVREDTFSRASSQCNNRCQSSTSTRPPVDRRNLAPQDKMNRIPNSVRQNSFVPHRVPHDRNAQWSYRPEPCMRSPGNAGPYNRNRPPQQRARPITTNHHPSPHVANPNYFSYNQISEFQQRQLAACHFRGPNQFHSAVRHRC